MSRWVRTGRCAFSGDTANLVTAEATGFLATSAKLNVALAKSTAANDTRRWTGIAASADSMSVVGLPDTFTVEARDLSVKYNKASGALGAAMASAIDWSLVVSASANPIRSLTSDSALVVSGLMRFNLGGYVLASGSFVVAKGTALVAATTSETVSADLLTIDLTGVNLFVGVGAAFTGSTAAIEVANATGFLAAGASLSLAMARSTRPNDTRRWTGIAASAGGLSVVGLPSAYTVEVTDLLVQYNAASGQSDSAVVAAPIAWAPLIAGETHPLENLTGTVSLKVSGLMRLNLGGYVMASGSFVVAKSSLPAANLGGNGVLAVDLLTLDLTSVNLFVGVGGAFAGTGSGITTTGATGFVAQSANLSVGLAKSTVTGDTRRWTGIAANAAKLTMVGLEGDFDASVYDLSVRYNAADGTSTGLVSGTAAVAFDWSEVIQSPTHPLQALNSGTSLAVSGRLLLGLGGVVQLEGSLNLSRSSVEGVTDPDASGNLLKGDLLSLAVTGLTVFVGSGASLNRTAGTVTLPASNDPAAVGFSLSGGSLRWALFTARASKTGSGAYSDLSSVRKYTGVSASLGKAQLQGVDSVKLIVTQLSVELSRVSGGTAILDWTQTAVSAAQLSLSASSPSFAIRGSAGFSIAEVVYGSATVSISKSSVSGVDNPLSADPADTLAGDLVSVSLSNAQLFVGTGASLNTDSTQAGFGTVSLPLVSDANAVGFGISNGSLKVAVFTTGSGVSAVRYTGVKASLGLARFQGVSAVQMVATDFSVQLNRVSAGSTLLDWTQGKSDATSASNPLAAAGLAIVATAPGLQIGGSVGLSLAEVVYGSAQFTVSRGGVTGVDDPDEATTATLNGDLLAVSITQGNLFIGTGASLNLTTGVATLPPTDSATAVGFGITNATLNLAVFAANQRVVSGTATVLTGGPRYTGMTGSFDRAELRGLDAVRMVGTNLTFKLNRTSVSTGGVLDWKQGKALVTDSGNPLSAAAVSLGTADPTFEIGGSVGLSIADVVLGNATVKVGRTQVTDVTVGSETL